MINAALAYKGTKVNTASPAELTLMLFEGAIKFCNIAMIGIENNDILKTNKNCKKAQKIIVELRSTLDFKYSVAEDFDRIYDYIYRRLVDANVKKDSAILQDALDQIRGMRDLWKQVMKQNNIYVK